MNNTHSFGNPVCFVISASVAKAKIELEIGGFCDYVLSLIHYPLMCAQVCCCRIAPLACICASL